MREQRDVRAPPLPTLSVTQAAARQSQAIAEHPDYESDATSPVSMFILIDREPEGVNLAEKETFFNACSNNLCVLSCKKMFVCRAYFGGCSLGEPFSNFPHKKC